MRNAAARLASRRAATRLASRRSAAARTPINRLAVLNRNPLLRTPSPYISGGPLARGSLTVPATGTGIRRGKLTGKQVAIAMAGGGILGGGVMAMRSSGRPVDKVKGRPTGIFGY